MSLFSTILEKLGIGKHAVPSADAATQTQTGGSDAAAPSTSTQTTSAPAPATAAISEVDVAATLEEKASKHSEPLNWRSSIVDLLKLLDMDSSLTARKDLAKELNYTGSTEDSAAMNIWLHKAVLQELAKNGGKVPAEFLD